ncbi:MAG: hypothetical protein ACRDQ5_17750, partial [Sciscionella sp.]
SEWIVRGEGVRKFVWSPGATQPAFGGDRSGAARGEDEGGSSVPRPQVCEPVLLSASQHSLSWPGTTEKDDSSTVAPVVLLTFAQPNNDQ